MSCARLVLKVLLGLVFVVAGINHFLFEAFYLRMLPPYLPAPRVLVFVSGVAEVVLGILFLIPKFTRLSAWGLIALLIAVFPANVQMALNPELFPEFSAVLLWLRLPLQAVLIAWAHRFTHPNHAALEHGAQHPL